MRHLKNYKLFQESNSYKTSINLVRDDNYNVDYTFEDDLGNRFLVQFKNILAGDKRLSKEYNISYFVWDEDIQNWSVYKTVKSNPYRIIRTVLSDILSDFTNRKLWCNRISFEGLSKETQREFTSQRTKLYSRFLEINPLPGFKMTNYGNKFILTRQ